VALAVVVHSVSVASDIPDEQESSIGAAVWIWGDCWTSTVACPFPCSRIFLPSATRLADQNAMGQARGQDLTSCLVDELQRSIPLLVDSYLVVPQPFNVVLGKADDDLPAGKVPLKLSRPHFPEEATEVNHLGSS
jgi:hypothetical protein